MLNKKGFLNKFVKLTGKHLCQSLIFNKFAGLRLETLTQVFSCEFWEIFKNTIFTEHLWTTVFEISIICKVVHFRIFPC